MTSPFENNNQDLWGKFWRDKHGRIVIWQTPNVWLIGWAVLTVTSLFLVGKPANVLSDIATVVLAIWALLEIFRGANYFRRLLGLVVLLFTIASFFKVGL